MSQRLSDAELAAEVWHAMYRYRTAEQMSSAFGSTVSVVLREHEAATLHRFATLPHAHEELGTYVFQCKECDMRLQTDDQHQCEIFARNHQYLAHDYYKDTP